MKNDFLQAVCRISSTETFLGLESKEYGNGVFIAPHHVLTVWHNLQDKKREAFTFKNSRNEKAHIKASSHIRFNKELDLALVELDQPIGEDLYRRPINRHILNAKGAAAPSLLASYFTERKTAISNVKPVTSEDTDEEDCLTVFSEKAFGPGCSGSPIYNKYGDIISLISRGIFDEIELKRDPFSDTHLQTQIIKGASPEHLANFVDSFLFNR